MSFGKKELIMSALVVTLGAAVYLNWQFGANAENARAENISDEELGQVHYVNAEIATTDSVLSNSNKKRPDSDASEKEKNSSVPLTNEEEYFAKVRLERKKIQDDLIDLAKEIVEATDSSTKGKEEAVAHLNELSDIIQQQTNVENLIIAKGFDDCAVFIQNGECSVVVTGKELKSDTLLAIKDIVISQTGIPFDKIRVTHI